MLEDKDIEKLVSVLATKADVKELKEDVSSLREIVQGLVVSTDNMAKSMEILGGEYGAVAVQLKRHEKWIKQISDKLGLELSFE